MRQSIFVGLVLLAALLSTSSHGAGEKTQQTFDYLQPIDFDLYIDFRAMVWKKLDLIPSDCGRVVVSPPDSAVRGEYAICVGKSNNPSEATKYTAQYTRAARALWWGAAATSKPEDFRDVPVSKIEVEVPELTALAIKKAWSAMLHRVKYEQPRAETIYIHPRQVEFEIADHEPCYGALPSGKLGKHTQALWDVSNLLLKYCEADSKERKSIATEIETKCADLVRDVPQT